MSALNGFISQFPFDETEKKQICPVFLSPCLRQRSHLSSKDRGGGWRRKKETQYSKAFVKALGFQGLMSTIAIQGHSTNP